MKARIIIVASLFVIIAGTISMIPKYPEINVNQSYEQVFKKIMNIATVNMQKAGFEYMDDKRKLLDMKKEAQQFVMKIKKCNKDKACLVDEYNNYMDDNVVDSLSMLYRYQYVDTHYGKVGVLMNEYLKEFY